MCVYKLGRKAKLTKDKYYWKIFILFDKRILRPMFSDYRYEYKNGLNKALVEKVYLGCKTQPYNTGFFCFKTKKEAERFLYYCGQIYGSNERIIKKIIIKKGTIIQHSYDKLPYLRYETHTSTTISGTCDNCHIYKTRALITPELFI